MALPQPKEMVEQLVRQAPDPAWLREVTDRLDRRVRAEPLERITGLWGLSGAEAGRIFGVSRQAFAKWRSGGVPDDRAEAVADLAVATELLDRKVKRERIPAVVRRAAPNLGDRSLYELACEDGTRALRDAVETLFDLRRIQP